MLGKARLAAGCKQKKHGDGLFLTHLVSFRRKQVKYSSFRKASHDQLNSPPRRRKLENEWFTVSFS